MTATADAAPPLPPGAAFTPRHRVTGLVVRGDLFDVYAAWDRERDCPCVLKTLRPDHLDDVWRERLAREGQLLARLTHPHIVRLYDVGTDPAYLSLETLTGETLTHLVERLRRRLSLAEVCDLGLQLCSALAYLHRQGWLHLDLKPANVVVTAAGSKLLDMSHARPVGQGVRGEGTAGYWAPEQQETSTAEIGVATDVWALGGTLYRALTRQRPVPPPPTERMPVRALRRVPRELADLVEAMLAHRPAGRPGLHEVRAVLASVLGEQLPEL